MLYQLHELQHFLMTPIRIQAALTRSVFQNPFNPMSHTQIGRTIAATAEVTERATRRFGRPDFGLSHTRINGKKVDIIEENMVENPFCNLLHFKRKTKRNDPKVLLVAPMSGHFATLLRGTVEALLPHHDVYITDWKDSRHVPLSEGAFSFDDYVTYLREYITHLGPDVHMIAVCQPAVPVLAAVSLMASDNDPNQPLSMTLMGGPIDTRVSKTEVTELAETKPLSWFENTVIQTVPAFYAGASRKVYPGFLQLSGFMSMNLDAHVGSHLQFYEHLIKGDGESSEKHRKFYNEYLAVMDIPAEFYLQTVEEVFQKHSLPRGHMKWREPLTGKQVDVRPKDITHTALLTVEGELDDISARGQTTAAHELCYNLPQRKQFHHFQLNCGHYGIFNGTRYRTEVMPRIRNFIRQFDADKDPIPAADLELIPDLKPDRFDHDMHGIVATRRWLKENNPNSFEGTRLPHAQYSEKPRLVAPQKAKSPSTIEKIDSKADDKSKKSIVEAKKADAKTSSKTPSTSKKKTASKVTSKKAATRSKAGRIKKTDPSQKA